MPRETTEVDFKKADARKMVLAEVNTVLEQYGRRIRNEAIQRASLRLDENGELHALDVGRQEARRALTRIVPAEYITLEGNVIDAVPTGEEPGALEPGDPPA